MAIQLHLDRRPSRGSDFSAQGSQFGLPKVATTSAYIVIFWSITLH